MKRRPFKRLLVAALTLSLLPLSIGSSPLYAKSKGKTLLGIAVGVAAGALILNEISKANEKKKYKKKHHHKKKYNKPKKIKKKRIHCHTNGKKHYHNVFKGRYWHAHEAEEGCGSYRLDPKYNDGPGTGAYKPKKAKNSGDPWQRCEQDFTTFSDDGTYQPAGNGPRKLCPYL